VSGRVGRKVGNKLIVAGGSSVNIKAIPLSRLEADPRGALSECADSGSIMVVELPDQRLVAIQSLDAIEDDDLINELLESNPRFRELVAKSRAGRRKPFPLGPDTG
jgi:hypothetical protein